jgi:hypothetical protein
MKPHLSQFLIIALKYVRNQQRSQYGTEGLLKLLGMLERAIEYGKKVGAPQDRKDPLKVQKITAKKLIRKAQRQAYSSSRNSWAKKKWMPQQQTPNYFIPLLTSKEVESHRTQKLLLWSIRLLTIQMTSLICGKNILKPCQSKF